MHKILKQALQYGLSLGLMGLFIYWAFEGINRGELWAAMTGISPVWAAVMCVVTLGTLVLRAWCWQVLMRPFAPQVSNLNASLALAICYAANVVVPRSGEVTAVRQPQVDRWGEHQRLDGYDSGGAHSRSVLAHCLVLAHRLYRYCPARALDAGRRRSGYHWPVGPSRLLDRAGCLGLGIGLSGGNFSWNARAARAARLGARRAVPRNPRNLHRRAFRPAATADGVLRNPRQLDPAQHGLRVYCLRGFYRYGFSTKHTTSTQQRRW